MSIIPQQNWNFKNFPELTYEVFNLHLFKKILKPKCLFLNGSLKKLKIAVYMLSTGTTFPIEQ